MKIAAIYLCYFLIQLSFKGGSMLASLYSLQLGASTSQISLVIACYSLAPLLFSVRVGRLCDEVGNRGPIYLGSLLCASSLTIPLLWQERLAAIMAGQLVFGLGHVMFQVSMQNLVGKISTETDRSNRFSMLSACMSFGNMISPLIVGALIDVRGYLFSYAVCASFSAGATVLACALFLYGLPLTKVTLPKSSEARRDFLPVDLLADKGIRRMLITSAIVMAGTTLFAFYQPLYASEIGYSASQVGVLASIYAMAFLCVRLLFPLLSKVLTPEQTLVCALVLAGLGYLAMSLVQNFAGLAAICFVVGTGLGCGYPLTMSMAYRSVAPERTGEVLGMRLMANRLVQLCLPIATGAISTSFSSIFFSLGVFLAGSASVYRGAFKRSDGSE